ncbi:MAG TPA: hypothetical protein ENH82_15680 [bacterium]|nr:hypothetical protein [bacterium]
MTYGKVYSAIPQEHKDAVEMIKDRGGFKKKTMKFSWIHIIIVPIQYNDGTDIASNIIANLKNDFISHFSGNTRIPATGEYISQYQGLQTDKCEIWSGFGKDEQYNDDIKFMESFADKVGSQNYCNQEGITISDNKSNIKILDTFDMSKEIELLSQQSLFNLRVMLLLASIAGTEVLYDNRSRVNIMAINLGFSISY